ncbi:hypothetical protein GCM10022198_03300 [Klugiella xanthotipulae]|uniref:Putative oligomerization/nucleic acid binding protein n=1 Tax=Klugiella xanthotipulae TaxID=244735 RepID=A0A543I6Z6_9MICO|nr:SHOCT domain-containing protein [Klugiella xanthotipulae]TQM66374.1 putative oligomerization/nucleic acid binding protein [Klugiella xanthotipulae]
MSLFRTAARVAVASSVHGRVQERQRQRWGAQSAAPDTLGQPVPPATPPAALDASLAQLKQLGELRDAGILSQAEFETKKALILGPSA